MSATRFIGARLTITRPGAVSNGVWTEPSAHGAAATLSGEASAQAVFSWGASPKGAEAAQAALVRCTTLVRGSSATTYVLVLTEAGQQEKTLAWDEATETPDLAEVRAFFEGAGHMAFALATAYRKRAASLLEQGRTAEGIAALRAGIDVLGKRYRNPGVIDDTGMKLVLATQSEKQGKLEIARNVYEGVLDSRLTVYEAGLGAG